MGSNYKITYGVDLVFCIDCSRSMEDCLAQVKKTIVEICDAVKWKMTEQGRAISLFRARIILFRDYLEDGNQAMLTTDFFQFPWQWEQFQTAVDSITAEGGGIGTAQDGMEALAFAIRTTPWDRLSPRKLHLIAVFSNNPAHPLGYASRSPYYPKNMATDFEELTSWWGNNHAPGMMDEYAKRMIIFAPDVPSWQNIRDNWNKVLHIPSEAGLELMGRDYISIISCITAGDL